MKICPNCNYFDEDGQKYCPLCGCDLIAKCPKCSLPINNPLSHYCAACGYKFEKMAIITKKRNSAK